MSIYGLYHAKADKAYDRSGELSYDPNFSKTESTVYIEYGLSDKWMLSGQTGLQSLHYRARAGTASDEGVGASRLGLQRKIWEGGGRVLSLSGSFIVAGPGENVPDADLGYGGNGLDLRALYGSNFKFRGYSGFFDGQAAWVTRRGFGGPDAQHLDLTAGLDIKRESQLIGQLFYQHTNEGADGADDIHSSQSLKAQLSWVRPGSRPGTKYQFGLTQTLTGKNIVRETGLVFSVWE